MSLVIEKAGSGVAFFNDLGKRKRLESGHRSVGEDRKRHTVLCEVLCERRSRERSRNT